MQEIIYKVKNNNRYINSDGVWVRDFTAKQAPFIDINNLFSEDEYGPIYNNESNNAKTRNPNIDSEHIKKQKILIVSDGFDFDNKHKLLSTLPKDVGIIAVNGALNNWKLVGNIPEKEKRSIWLYVVNNPYDDCYWYLPKSSNYYPKCVASLRTNNRFITDYKGNIYFYSPTNNDKYIGPKFSHEYMVDDYRNSVVAAIGLAYRFGVEKLMLLGVDESFSIEKPGAVKLENGLWTYPQQIKSQNIIDSNLHWMKDIKVGYHTSGIKLKNATYIKEEEINKFYE